METGNRARRSTPAYGRYRQFPAGDGATAPRVGGDLGGGGARAATSVARRPLPGRRLGGWGAGVGTGRVRGAVRRVSLCGVLSPGGHDVTASPRFPVPVYPGYCRVFSCSLDDHHSR